MGTKGQGRTQDGATLIELLMSLGIGGTILTLLAVSVVFSARTFAAIANYVELDTQSRNAIDRITRDIRQADSLSSVSTNSWVLLNGSNSLSYVYSPNAATLSRIYNGSTNVLLTKVVPNSLSVSMYQRNPIGGEVDAYSTTSASLCKVLQVSWTCTRTMLGASTTESLQSAKVMIRKQ